MLHCPTFMLAPCLRSLLYVSLLHSMGVVAFILLCTYLSISPKSDDRMKEGDSGKVWIDELLARTSEVCKKELRGYKIHFRNRYLAQWLGHHSEYPYPISEWLALSLGSSSNSSFLQMYSLVGGRWQFKYLGPLPPMWEIQTKSQAPDFSQA